MRRPTVICLWSVILATVSGSSQAQTLDNDGGTYTVNGPSGPIEVLNGSTLNINSPAYITGPGLASPLAGSLYGDASSTIKLDGGQVVSQKPDSAAFLTYGTFIATGGTIQGGQALTAFGSVQISGGSFLGYGDTPFPSFATGAYIETLGGEGVSISGGTFQGNAPNSPNGGVGLLLDLQSGTQASISGGVFIGVPDGPTNQPGFDSLVYDGGPNTVTNISGGLFEDAMALTLTDQTSILNFFGQDFLLQSVSSGEYQLTGVLADGNSLDVTVFSSRDFNTSLQTVGSQEEFTFTGLNDPPPPLPVPEPSSIVTLAIGLAGLATAGTYRRRLQGHRKAH